MEWVDAPERARRPKRLPVVLTRAETGKILNSMGGVTGLIERLLYGSGLRLLEALTLRVKDIDFARHHILIRNAKGQKDRHTVLLASINQDLQRHMERGSDVCRRLKPWR